MSSHIFLLVLVLILIALWVSTISIVFVFSSILAVLACFGSPLFVTAPLVGFSCIATMPSAIQGVLTMLASVIVWLLILAFHASSVTTLALVFVGIAVLMGVVAVRLRCHSKA